MKITTKAFEYIPNEITLKKGEPGSGAHFAGLNLTVSALQKWASVPICHRAKPRECSLRLTRPEASLFIATISAAPAMKT